MALNVGYLDRRHVLPPLLPLLGYAAVGLRVVGAFVQTALSDRAGFSRLAGPPVRGIVFVLVLVALLTLPKTWSHHREERLASRRAAEWLAARDDLTGPVAATKYRDAYYAGEAFIHVSRAQVGDAEPMENLRSAGARFLVIDEEELARRPALAAAAPGRLRELHRAEAADRVAFVYELVEPD